MSAVGLLLAAGQGTRMGMPKALVRGENAVPWLVSSTATLVAAGCAEVLVVLGAAAEEAIVLLDGADHVIASNWDEGMGASLRAGLQQAQETDHDAALVHLVDLPDVGAGVVRRVLAHTAPDALVRATYAGVPGHPVLIGREHWAALLEEVGGDEGAREYLARHETMLVECGDLATGQDIDTPEGL